MKKKIVYIAAIGIAIAIAITVVIVSFSFRLTTSGGVRISEPPTMLLMVDNEQYEAGIGSFCSNTMCADRTLESSVPQETVLISQDSRLEILTVDYPIPEILDVTLHDTDLNMTEFKPQQLSQTEFVANIPQGEYILGIFAKWEDAEVHDSSYFYRIRVV